MKSQLEKFASRENGWKQKLEEEEEKKEEYKNNDEQNCLIIYLEKNK